MTMLRDISSIAAELTTMAFAAAECKLSQECRHLGSRAAKIVLGLGLLSIFLLFLTAGFLFVLFGIYFLLAARQDAPAAAMTLGGAVVLAGLILCWLAVHTEKKDN
ncbi:MAG: hypothetical protein LLF76_10270 [Planctomycetaceae bacterium]|nr:hypothetical protein [Planctomycetaceae bacterium]